MRSSPPLLLGLLLLGLSVAADAQSTVNNDAKEKTKAKKAAIKAYEEEHGTVFDSYGRVMKWGKKVTKTDCRKKKSGDGSEYICEVKESEERKYRTKEETLRQQVIKLDRQAEADRIGGDDSEDAESKKRLKKESRARCSLFKDWLAEYEKDAQDKKPQFFNFLASNYEDYGALQKLARQGNKKEERKASKLYRHIAKESRTDRLPDGCKGEEFVTMMVGRPPLPCHSHSPSYRSRLDRFALQLLPPLLLIDYACCCCCRCAPSCAARRAQQGGRPKGVCVRPGDMR
jgi:hypothetical protein